MVWVAGVDGCRAGWLMVRLALPASPCQRLQVSLHTHFDEVLTAAAEAVCLAVDMPIGLLDQPQAGGRHCDRLARRLLGRRASSVFNPPSRVCLDATSYDQVRTYGVSRQAFGILPKIRAVDAVMTPALQQRVCEAHPELAFRSLHGTPMQGNKKTPAGYAERLQALQSIPLAPFQQAAVSHFLDQTPYKRTQVARDDYLDATVLVWTAYRIARGQAYRLPEHPPSDRRALRMEIWY
jgi:predicted RNase H-like nuclease